MDGVGEDVEVEVHVLYVPRHGAPEGDDVVRSGGVLVAPPHRGHMLVDGTEDGTFVVEFVGGE